MAERIIDIAGLTKVFGSTRALDGLDLTLDAGEVLGFLGPNGSGKSTTIRIVLGLMRKSGGEVRLFGRDPWSDATALHRRLAYVPGETALWPSLTGGQCIDMLGSAGTSVDPALRAELLERFDLDPTKRIRDYSKGNRQKVALIAALATHTDLLVLDEPTSGLDPIMEEVFREIVKERAEEGTAVLLSSHILSEVEALCETVTIIRRGRVVESGSVADLRRLARTSIHAVTLDGDDVELSIDPDEIDATLRPLLDRGVSALTVRPPSLDELFLSAYQDDDAGDDTDDGPGDDPGDDTGAAGTVDTSESAVR